MTNLWIVTMLVNDYNQHGEYFVAAFTSKPTFSDLRALEISSCDKEIENLTRGGGRSGREDVWYKLREVKPGGNYKS